MKPFFLGQYQRILEQGRRLRLPSKFVRTLKISSHDMPMGCPMIVAPLDECLIMLPFDYFENSGVHRWLRDMSWAKEISAVVSNNRVYPCTPLYKSDKISQKVREAVRILEGETRRAPGRLEGLSGRDFEKLLYEILASLGINVQLNVRIQGAEVDLLLLELSEHGQVEFTIIECKHRQRSQTPVGINQVVRLYGLREALRKHYCAKNALIVSTTGFSPGARQFARLYKLDLLNFEGFLDWILAHNLVSDSRHFPLFRITNLDRRGRFYLPESLISYLRLASPRVEVIGLYSRIELWNPPVWEDLVKKLEWEGDLIAQELADLGI